MKIHNCTIIMREGSLIEVLPGESLSFEGNDVQDSTITIDDWNSIIMSYSKQVLEDRLRDSQTDELPPCCAL